jgi:hypothetical protein
LNRQDAKSHSGFGACGNVSNDGAEGLPQALLNEEALASWRFTFIRPPKKEGAAMA